jgi:hypothetical protein
MTARFGRSLSGSSTVLLPRLGRITLRTTRALKPKYCRCKGGRLALGPTKEILVPAFVKIQAPWATLYLLAREGWSTVPHYNFGGLWLDLNPLRPIRLGLLDYGLRPGMVGLVMTGGWLNDSRNIHQTPEFWLI